MFKPYKPKFHMPNGMGSMHETHEEMKEQGGKMLGLPEHIHHAIKRHHPRR
jgi:hypothetical protein